MTNTSVVSVPETFLYCYLSHWYLCVFATLVVSLNSSLGLDLERFLLQSHSIKKPQLIQQFQKIRDIQLHGKIYRSRLANPYKTILILNVRLYYNVHQLTRHDFKTTLASEAVILRTRRLQDVFTYMNLQGNKMN